MVWTEWGSEWQVRVSSGTLQTPPCPHFPAGMSTWHLEGVIKVEHSLWNDPEFTNCVLKYSPLNFIPRVYVDCMDKKKKEQLQNGGSVAQWCDRRPGPLHHALAPSITASASQGMQQSSTDPESHPHMPRSRRRKRSNVLAFLWDKEISPRTTHPSTDFLPYQPLGLSLEKRTRNPLNQSSPPGAE